MGTPRRPTNVLHFSIYACHSCADTGTTCFPPLKISRNQCEEDPRKRGGNRDPKISPGRRNGGMISPFLDVLIRNLRWNSQSKTGRRFGRIRISTSFCTNEDAEGPLNHGRRTPHRKISQRRKQTNMCHEKRKDSF